MHTHTHTHSPRGALWEAPQHTNANTTTDLGTIVVLLCVFFVVVAPRTQSRKAVADHARPLVAQVRRSFLPAWSWGLLFPWGMMSGGAAMEMVVMVAAIVVLTSMFDFEEFFPLAPLCFWAELAV